MTRHQEGHRGRDFLSFAGGASEGTACTIIDDVELKDALHKQAARVSAHTNARAKARLVSWWQESSFQDSKVRNQ